MHRFAQFRVIWRNANAGPYLCEFNPEPTTGLTMLDQEIERNFTYQPPKQGQPERYEKIRAEAKKLAYLINEECLPSREKSLALTNLEQVVFWAKAAIVRNETRGADFTPERPSIISMMLQNWMDQKHMAVQEVDRAAAKPLFDALGLNVDDYI